MECICYCRVGGRLGDERERRQRAGQARLLQDYRALCSQFSSDSPEVRRCMRSAGEKLSPRCLNALIAAGEVSETEVVARRAAQARQ